MNVCKFHGKWQREGHTLLMNVNWNYIYICNNIFLGPSPHTCHPTKTPHLALTLWSSLSNVMAVMITTSIHRLMLLYVPKISLFSFSYLRNKQSGNTAYCRSGPRILNWCDKMTLSRNEAYDKIMSFTWAIILGTKEMNNTCAKMTHMGMMDRGSTVL